jgi:hypothetical protein
VCAAEKCQYFIIFICPRNPDAVRLLFCDLNLKSIHRCFLLSICFLAAVCAASESEREAAAAGREEGEGDPACTRKRMECRSQAPGIHSAETGGESCLIPMHSRVILTFPSIVIEFHFPLPGDGEQQDKERIICCVQCWNKFG